MDKLTTSLQESVITLLCMDDAQGAIAAGLVDVELFEPPYDDVAARAIAFRKQFGKAPGNAHIDDLFDHILADPKNKRHRIYQQVLQGIVEQAKGLNAPYILSRVHDFTRRQQLKAAVLEAAERYQRGDEGLVADVENILHRALKFKPQAMDAGVFLNDRKQALRWLNQPRAESYMLGIPELDRRGIGPAAGRLFMFTAPKGRGKSWFCVDAGVRMMQQGVRVVHVTLEMTEDEVLQRYFQRLFAVAKRDEAFETTRFELDELQRLSGFIRKKQRPRLSLTDAKLATTLAKRMGEWGSRFGRLVVKGFPVNSLNMGHLEAYLDNLELTSKFVPTALIVDYPEMMELDKRQELRIAIGNRAKELKGLAQARNLALVAPAQSNRAGEDAKLITAKHQSEDYSKTQTADFNITYNQTAMERELGLARLFVEKARHDEDHFTVLISQSYKTGQFCVQSAYMSNTYWEQVKEAVGAPEDE